MEMSLIKIKTKPEEELDAKNRIMQKLVRKTGIMWKILGVGMILFSINLIYIWFSFNDHYYWYTCRFFMLMCAIILFIAGICLIAEPQKD